MSNDKAAATYHGRKRTFDVGDWVYVTQLPEFGHRLGQVVKIQDSMEPYVVQIDMFDEFGSLSVNRAFDWLALTPYTEHVQPSVPETTGEHVFHKLGDDLYQDWAGDNTQSLPVTAAQAADWVARDPEGYFAAVREYARKEATASHAKPRPKRDWAPTSAQLAVALSIGALTVGLIGFFVFFYRGW